ncbi:hypothetical protein [Azospirillum sp. TSH64]|uniref:hypothetical protein n=1 Tax=Azospirillum sp. TSH64 TaxID=652740 RepID=UPI000D61A305|nr:hypothetical protein [Azospirillum sp. TSH64]PWC81271.1 hypothetical protein TSH64_01110 [Azospirillum sp. TSH64]
MNAEEILARKMGIAADRVLTVLGRIDLPTEALVAVGAMLAASLAAAGGVGREKLLELVGDCWDQIQAEGEGN